MKPRVLFCALFFLLGCSHPGWSAWDCHGAGYMQGCVGETKEEVYFQTCERKSLLGEVQIGYQLVGEQVVHPGELIYHDRFPEGQICFSKYPYTPDQSSQVSRRQNTIMQFPQQE